MSIKKVSQRSVKQMEKILSIAAAAAQREHNLSTEEFDEGEEQMSKTLDRFWKTIEKCAKSFIKREKKKDRYFDVAEFKECIDIDVRSSNGDVFRF